jgi:cytochrome c peroxidase
MPRQLMSWPLNQPVPKKLLSIWATAALLAAGAAGCDFLGWVGPPRPALPPKTAAPSPEHDLVERPPDELVDGRVLLGSPSLTAGITGAGPLTLPQVEAWLADPQQHEPLDFVLPIGLRELADQVRIPPDNPLTRAKIELGRQLFADPRLAGSGKRMACFQCHVPRNAFTDHALVGDPTKGVPRRAPPALINRLFSETQFWDGRAGSLEEQVLQPIYSSYEMANTPEGLLAFLSSNPVYRRQFELIFGELSEQNVAKALASFVRAIVSGDSPYDYWRGLQAFEGKDPADLSDAERAELEALQAGAGRYPWSAAAAKGHALFVGKAKCAACHSGPNFSDEKFHNVGIGRDDTEEPDLGRYVVTGREADRGAFKTPTLRHVAETGPYMHRSQLSTLQAVVDYLAAGGAPGPHQDPLVELLDLSAAERRQLIAFLASLSGRLPPVSLGRLPEVTD